MSTRFLTYLSRLAARCLPVPYTYINGSDCEGARIKAEMNKARFREADSLYMLRAILSGACSNLRGKKLRDEVVELDVTTPWSPDNGPMPIMGTWMRVIPIHKHDWPCCAVLLLQARTEDERPNPVLRTAAEVPSAKILLSAHQLWDAVIDKLSHWSSSHDRLVVLLPVEGSEDEYVHTIIRDMSLSDDGEGSKLLLDLVAITDLDGLARYFGPPFYGFANV